MMATVRPGVRVWLEMLGDSLPVALALAKPLAPVMAQMSSCTATTRSGGTARPGRSLAGRSTFILATRTVAAMMAVTGGVVINSCLAALDAQERAALVDIYVATGGPFWSGSTSNTNWLVADPCSNRWAGVVCNIDQTSVR
jgi:hypothetical protein